MKTIVKDRYGSPDVLRIEEVDLPVPNADQVLVRLHATAINAHDWHMLRGKPYLARLTEGFRRPKERILGLDVAGVAESVGADVTHVKPGDRVFGSRYGAFAEYVAGKSMVPIPDGITFAQAAAVPTAGQTALFGLRDKGELQPGQHVLINGAGGGVGTFAVQIAKALGAEVTAVTSTRNVELVASIGADHVIDYTSDDFTRDRGRYDLILDIGGNRSLRHMRRALRERGIVVMVAPDPGQWLGPVLRLAGAVLTTKMGAKPARAYLAPVNRENLTLLGEMMTAGTLNPVIDRTYPFDAIPDAIRYVEQGHARGKVVVRVT
jgi:NADPH:quinone reductase-like Zn-dependent oxidoreductase